MKAREYQKKAMRTNDRMSCARMMSLFTDLAGNESHNIDLFGVMNGCLGLAGESGETLDMIKKWAFHEKPLDVEHFKKELGDVLWYVAMICESFGFDMDEIMQMNIDKLEARYPNGFDTDRSNNRQDGDV